MVHLFTVNKTIQSMGYPPLIILSKLSSVTDGIVEFKKYEIYFSVVFVLFVFSFGFFAPI